MAPLATHRALTVRSQPLLGKDASVGLLLEWLLAHEAAPWALCTHGEVFAALLVACRAAGLVTTQPRTTEKGAAWRLTRLGDRSVDLEYLPPSSGR